MATRLNAVAPVFVVRNLVSSVEYWRDRVGFNEVEVYGEPPGFALCSRDGVVVMLAQAPDGRQPPPPNWSVVDKCNQAYVWVQDVDALYVELNASGATIDYTIYNTPWGTREFGIQDLDEHDITFGEALCNT